MPLVLVLILAVWIYVPRYEARSQQNALATEFFEACKKTLKDTEQLPQVPEEALQEALKRHPVTSSAVSAWDPEVSAEIRKGQWVAKIQFQKSAGYTVEETIGPVLAEAGYDTPSPGP
jgi:hypothetical protein